MYLCTKEDYIAMKVALGCDPEAPDILRGYPGVEIDEEEVKKYYMRKFIGGNLPWEDEENNTNNNTNGEHKV